MIDKLYTFVDKESKKILVNFDFLPNNWKNYSNINFMSESELKDLGWINATDPDLLNYSYSKDLFDQFKYRLCDAVANLRWEAQTDAVTYKENVYVLSDKTVSALYQKRLLVANNLDLTYNWKSRDDIIQLTGHEIVSLTDAIHNYIQSCFDVEADFISKITSKKSLKTLLALDYNITWPSTKLL